MISKKIFITLIILIPLFVFYGCNTGTKPKAKEGESIYYKQDMVTQAMEHAQQMQLAAIKAQDENAVLRAKIDELTKQLEALQSNSVIEKPETEEPLTSDNFEQKYKELQDKNEELRKLVQYERGLREDLMRRIDQDQITINELKSRLGE